VIGFDLVDPAVTDQVVEAFANWRLTAAGLQLAGDERSVRHQTTTKNAGGLPTGDASFLLTDSTGSALSFQP